MVEANESNINVKPILSTGYRPDQKYDCLITEIFDCGLLGEDAIRSILDAHKRLLKKGAKVIPNKGRIYAQAANLQADNLKPYRLNSLLLGCHAFRRRKPEKGNGDEPYEGKKQLFMFISKTEIRRTNWRTLISTDTRRSSRIDGD